MSLDVGELMFHCCLASNAFMRERSCNQLGDASGRKKKQKQN